MNNPYPPEIQRRLRALYLYIQALEAGDLERLSRLLRMAEQDAALDRMFQEIDLHYQLQGQPQRQPDAALAQRLVQRSLQEIRPDQPAFQPFQQERRHTGMHHSVDSLVSEQVTQDLPQMYSSQQKTRRQRAPRFWQVLVAALLAIILLSSFLFFSRRFTLSNAVNSTSNQLIGMSEVVQSVLVNGATQLTTTYTLQALRAESRTPIWSTALLSTKDDGVRTPLLVQNQVIYTDIGNTVFAVNAKNGQVLWKKTFSFAYGLTGLQVNGDLLMVSGLDVKRVGSIYRIDEQTGRLLWNAQAVAFALGNGTIYVGQEIATSSSPLNPAYQHFLRALDPNGKVIWSRSNVTAFSLTVLNSIIYVESTTRGATGSVTYSLSAWTKSGSKLWLDPLSAPIMNGAGWPDTLIGSGLLNIFSDHGILVFEVDGAAGLCTYQAENGQKIWCLPQQPNISYAYLQAYNDVIYTVYVVSPIIVGSGHVNPDYIQALNLQTGAVIWSHQAGSSGQTTQQGSPTGENTAPFITSEQAFLVTGDTLLITSDASLFAFSLSHGLPLWQASIKIPGSMKNLAMLGFVNLVAISL